MSLNDIKLSPILVKKMYEKILVISSFANSKIGDIKEDLSMLNDILDDGNREENFNYLGKNEKHILILVNEDHHTFLGDDELSFLLNILSACHITMADVALINCFENKNANYEKLIKKFAPSTILFFSIEPQDLNFPVHIPLYQVQTYNTQQYLCAPSLKRLASEKEQKKQLWLALKKIFSIT